MTKTVAVLGKQQRAGEGGRPVQVAGRGRSLPSSQSKRQGKPDPGSSGRHSSVRGKRMDSKETAGFSPCVRRSVPLGGRIGSSGECGVTGGKRMQKLRPFTDGAFYCNKQAGKEQLGLLQ